MVRGLGRLWIGLILGVVLALMATARQSTAAPSSPPSASASASATASPNASPSPAASEASSSMPVGYVDNSTCVHCHEVQSKDFDKTMMGHVLMARQRDEREKLGCQACHGPGREHVRHPHKPAAGFLTFHNDPPEARKAQNERCLECHENGARAFWRASTHAFRGVTCVDCHTVMCPVTATLQFRKPPLGMQLITPVIVTRAETQVCIRCHLKKKMEINLPFHMPLREGLMTCADCHNPHGGPYPHQLKAATVNEVCYTCHAEKRGPFLWIHAPVQMNCLNCHVPHGSVNQHMLIVRGPQLCQRCHIGTFHPSTPQKP